MIKNGNIKQEAMTASPDKYPQKHFKDKSCKRCGSVFSPKAPSHLYCSQQCADESIADHYYKRTYGISLDTYKELLEQQDHKCAICQQEGFVMAEHHQVKLMVDHCHTTGAVRGLLCHNCNRALGLLQDSRQYLLNAVKYLEGATTIPKGSTSQAIGDGSA
jgi:hypothetical protein